MRASGTERRARGRRLSFFIFFRIQNYSKVWKNKKVQLINNIIRRVLAIFFQLQPQHKNYLKRLYSRPLKCYKGPHPLIVIAPMQPKAPLLNIPTSKFIKILAFMYTLRLPLYVSTCFKILNGIPLAFL